MPVEAAFPDAIVIGEEGAHKNPALLQAIASAELAFIVDPIDGTRNFTANLPLFGVMAAATVYGEIVAGVIYDPVCQDWAYAGSEPELGSSKKMEAGSLCGSPHRRRFLKWKVSLARIFCRNRSEAPSIAIVRDWQAALGCDVRARIPYGGGWKLPPAILQQAHAMGSCRRVALT